MTGFTIIIAAKNMVGRTVDAVKNKLFDLNKSIGKVRFAIRGMTIGIGALAIGAANLLKESTKTDELEAAFERVSAKWAELKGIIGDGLADIFAWMARPIEALVDAFQAIIDKTQQVAAAVTMFMTKFGSGKGLGEMWGESWQEGGEVVADMRADRAARKAEAAEAKAAAKEREAAERAAAAAAERAAAAAEREAEAKAKAAAAAKEKAGSDLAAAQAKVRERQYEEADVWGKIEMLREDKARAKQDYEAEYWDANRRHGGMANVETMIAAQTAAQLNYQEKVREIDKKITELRQEYYANLLAQHVSAEQTKVSADKTKQYAQAEAKWKQRSAAIEERIAKLKEGIAQDEATADAQVQAAEEHRERGMNYKAARAADKEAAREERRWQNRLNQAKRMENTRLSQDLPGMRPWARLSKGFDKTERLPGWAREVLASDKASKAAKAAEQAAATKRAELERAEAAKNKAVVEMEKDLKQIREDLEKALKPA